MRKRLEKAMKLLSDYCHKHLCEQCELQEVCDLSDNYRTPFLAFTAYMDFDPVPKGSLLILLFGGEWPICEWKHEGKCSRFGSVNDCIFYNCEHLCGCYATGEI